MGAVKAKPGEAPGRWRCVLCGKGGKSREPMTEFYFHWRTFHQGPPPTP